MSNVLEQAAEAPETVQRQAHVEDFDEIVRDNQKRIYRILYLLLHDADEANSLTQECFLRAFARRANFRAEANVGTWLVRIAINLAQDHRKSRRTTFWRRLLRGQDQEIAARRIANPSLSPEDEMLVKESVASVWAAAERLSMQQRAVFMLRYGEDMSLREIADAMKLREGTVKAHLSKATNAVRRELERRR